VKTVSGKVVRHSLT